MKNRTKLDFQARCITKWNGDHEMAFIEGKVYDVYMSSFPISWVALNERREFIVINDLTKCDSPTGGKFFNEHFEMVNNMNEAWDRAMSIL